MSDANAAAMKAEANAAQVDPAQTMTAEVSQLAALHPAGAQFSSCTAENIGIGAMAAGVVSVIVGLALRFDNPTCTTPSYSGTTCGPDGCYTTTVYGQTTCTQANYYPHAQSGDDTMIAGGIVAGIGALLFALNEANGC